MSYAERNWRLELVAGFWILKRWLEVGIWNWVSVMGAGIWNWGNSGRGIRAGSLEDEL